MGLLDTLFKPGTQETTSTTSTAYRPIDARNYNQASRDEIDIRKDAENIYNNAGPQKFAGLSDKEKQALRDAGIAVDDANAATSGISAGLAGQGQYDLQRVQGLDRGLGDLYGVDDLQDSNFNALREEGMNPYTNAVVDTTLSGMNRQAQREQLQRDARSSGIGGVSNSRSAVADAVAGQLTGMNMAEMEAKLRGDAFNSATSTALSRQSGDRANELAKAGLSTEQAQAQAAQEAASAGFDLDQEQQFADYSDTRFDNELGRSNALEQYNNAEYLRSMGLAGLTGAVGETQRGIEDARNAERANWRQDALDWRAGINDTVSPGQRAGTQTTVGVTPTPSMFNQIAGAGLNFAAAGMGA